MLRCAVLSRCAGTAFRTIRNPCSLSTRHWRRSDFDRGLWRQTQRQLFKKACRSGHNIANFFLNQFLLRKDLRGKFQLSRLRNIAQFLRLLVRLQQRAFSSLNHKQ